MWKGAEVTATIEENAIEASQSGERSFLRRRGVDLAINVLMLACLWFAYSAVRGVTADDVSTAMGNAADLLHFQTVVGLPSELAFQQNVIGQTELLRGANIYYIAIHFPVTVAFLVWSWLRHREHFARIRNTLMAVTVVGLVVHLVYPLAPPRMIRGFVDTAEVIGPSPYDLEVSSAANQIAAMPSLHVGWALLVALGVIWVLDTGWRYLVLVHPVVTAVVVVVTANHYWTDAIVAASLVGIVWVAFKSCLPQPDV